MTNAPLLIWVWPNDVEDGYMAASLPNEPPTPEYAGGSHVEYAHPDAIAAAVAAEREACASLVILGTKTYRSASEIAAAIRARGET